MQKTIVSWVYEKGVSWDLLRICDQLINGLWHPSACPVSLTFRDQPHADDITKQTNSSFYSKFVGEINLQGFIRQVWNALLVAY